MDLRRRVFAAWQQGEDSQAAVAERFHVSTSFVRDLSRRFRESGSVAAKPRAGGKPPLASAATLECLQGLVACTPDATIEEHRQSLAAAGHPLSAATVGRLLLALGLTRKKRRLGTTSATPSVSKPRARSSRRK